MRRTKSTGGRHAAARPLRPKRHHSRWAAIVVGLAVPALAVPYLLLTRDDSEPVRVNAADYYQFVSMRDGTALDVAGADDADGVRIQQEKRADGAASQQWQLKLMTDGFCQLVNHNSGKVLGIRKSAAVPADVEQQSDTGADTQQWLLTDVGGGEVKIVSRDGGLVLSVTDGTDRHAVVEPGDRGSADQRWNLAKAATVAKPPAPVVAAARRSPGSAWQRVNDDQHQYGGGSSVVTGEPDVFGRVRPGAGAARGVLYGEPS